MTARNLDRIVTTLLLMVLAASCARTRRAEPFAEAENSPPQAASEEQHLPDNISSETDKRLNRVLAKYPRADANGDGILTVSEIRTYMAEQREAGKRRRSAGMPAGFRMLYASRQYVNKDGRWLRYDIMKPKDYDPQQKYPLVLCLHGSAGSTQAARVLAEPRLRAKYPCFALAPEALVGEAWGERPFGATTDVQPLVLEIIRALQNEFSIDAKRLYVTGQSAGGFGTYAFIIQNPDMFAAAAPVCGAVDAATANRIAQIPT
jgi:acetyl esterase/lipase